MSSRETPEQPELEKDEEVLQKVFLSTNSIQFSEPFTEVKTVKIQVYNPTNRTIGFKIRSTRPKELTARPSFAILRENRGCHVKIQACKLPEPRKPPIYERLTFVFAVVPKGKHIGKPSNLWKGKDGPPESTRSIRLNVFNDRDDVSAETAAPEPDVVEDNEENWPEVTAPWAKLNETDSKEMTEAYVAGKLAEAPLDSKTAATRANLSESIGEDQDKDDDVKPDK